MASWIQSRWLAFLMAIAAIAGLGLVLHALSSRPAPGNAVRATLTAVGAMGGDVEGYERAYGPRQFTFPEDHGPHPGYRTEWWYLTGNLATAEGREFGYQLTFFRNALAADAPERQSAWATDQVYMAHFAVTDVETNRFHAFDRFGRGALGLAGAEREPFRVWLEDWKLESLGPEGVPFRARAAEGDVAIDFILEAGKPPVLQGEEGLSQKGPEPGNASYYYSFTRMPTRGTIRIGETEFEVTGASWMDREWSTSALGGDQVGWDWFSLQLDDGRDLMYFQIRQSDGRPDEYSTGSLVGVDGAKERALRAGDAELRVLDHWTSPRDGTRYPARWRLTIPTEALDLTITPVIPDQELNLAVRYWEGAVRVAGTAGGRPIGGQGYVEMTGYADPVDDAGTP